MWLVGSSTPPCVDIWRTVSDSSPEPPDDDDDDEPEPESDDHRESEPDPDGEFPPDSDSLPVGHPPRLPRWHARFLELAE